MFEYVGRVERNKRKKTPRLYCTTRRERREEKRKEERERSTL